MKFLYRYNSYVTKPITIILFLFSINISFSQQKVADSLLNEYNNSSVDTTKIDILLKLIDALYESNPEKAIELGKAGLKIAQRINDTHREVKLYNQIGSEYDQLGNIGAAIENLDQSFRLANENLNLADLAQLKLHMGTFYAEIGNYHIAIENYLCAEHYFSILNDAKGLCKTDVDLSDAYYQSNNPDKALYYIERGMRISQKENGYFLEYLYVNSAEAYYRKKDLVLAEQFALKSIELAQKTNDLYILSETYLILSKVAQERGEITKAQELVSKGFEIAKETNIKENLIDAYQILSSVFEKQHNFEKALEFNKQYVIAKDSVQSVLNNNLLRTYEYEKQNENIALMKANEKEKDTELKQQHIFSIIILVVLLLVIYVSIYINKSRGKLKIANQEIEHAYKEVNNKQKDILEQNIELINSNEQIKRQSADIEQLNSIKDRLFSIIAHDLRSPLAGLKGILDLLVKGALSQERFQTIIPKLIGGVSSTLSLVENLLHWSKSQLSGTSILSTDFDIHYLIQNQLSLFEKQATDKQILITNNTAINTIVFADKDMIDLVLRNLVANAVKFCNKSVQIFISSKSYNTHLEISVLDEGIGIAPENIDKVFQTKERYTTAGTDNEIGTGLGLLLCKDFIEKNNGTIGVDSTLTKGSRFWFTLPLGTTI